MQAVRVLASNNYSALTCCMRQNLLRQCVAANVISHQHRFMSAEAALSTPDVEGTPKVYPEKIQNIVSEISRLNLLEVADLNELLKRTLNISGAPVMAFGAGMPMAAAPPVEEEEEVAPKHVQTLFTVKMNSFKADKKIPLIKEVKAQFHGFNLVQAKKFVESCPTIVRADISKKDAEKLAEVLRNAGADCVIE